MKTFTFATTFLAAAASASPVFDIRPDSEAAPLVKRDTEIVYLANCVDAVSCCRPNINYSEIIYYPTSASSQNGAVPPASNQCKVSSSNFITWEGSKHPCTFSTGVTFTSNIDSGAQNRATYAYAG
ncbi:MAG: hypothetical protein Q9202_004919, partial [Teloschistes flavicans]